MTQLELPDLEALKREADLDLAETRDRRLGRTCERCGHDAPLRPHDKSCGCMCSLDGCAHAAPWSVQLAVTRVQLWAAGQFRERCEALRARIRHEHALNDTYEDAIRFDALWRRMQTEWWFHRADLLHRARWWLLESKRRYVHVRDEDGLDSWQRDLLYVHNLRQLVTWLDSGARFLDGRGAFLPFATIVKEQTGLSFEVWRSGVAEAIRSSS